ncbi:hypothetical protein ACFPES_25945 [Paenibacillus sp. GCM10023248]|uniref:hypothetical protein n=1 Tax=Bacillales TaxID=1385 RepID=UPI002379F1FE|nr:MULTISPECIES: hypothetical protein [Bacillales]MDD9270503.1 hypothetical protein [Paenibacillus sp. MAHUQ-63]MDR6884133.1 hypothetical protein [Bacillus sp. 3255]
MEFFQLLQRRPAQCSISESNRGWPHRLASSFRVITRDTYRGIAMTKFISLLKMINRVALLPNEGSLVTLFSS